MLVSIPDPFSLPFVKWDLIPAVKNVPLGIQNLFLSRNVRIMLIDDVIYVYIIIQFSLFVRDS